MLVLVVAEMLGGLAAFVAAISSRCRPGELDGQDCQQEDEDHTPHHQECSRASGGLEFAPTQHGAIANFAAALKLQCAVDKRDGRLGGENENRLCARLPEQSEPDLDIARVWNAKRMRNSHAWRRGPAPESSVTSGQLPCSLGPRLRRRAAICSSAPQERAAKGQVESQVASQRVMAFAQRVDAVEVQAGRTAPHDGVPVFEAHAA